MKTLKLRINDKHAKVLIQFASETNFVWNYVNELGCKYLQRTGQFFSAFDIAAYTKGASKSGLNLHSQTIQAITEELVIRRKQFKKVKLNWRTSNPKSQKKSLGWIPFKASGIQYQNGQVKYAGQWFGLWDSYTTQTCSCCGSRHDSPKGMSEDKRSTASPERKTEGYARSSGLRIREWTCQGCGTAHDLSSAAAQG
jgi:transposase